MEDDLQTAVALIQSALALIRVDDEQEYGLGATVLLGQALFYLGDPARAE